MGKKIITYLLCAFMCGLPVIPCTAQTQLTLSDAIRIAHDRSYDSQVARFSFLASYWTYRSFKAQLLPSMNLSGNLMNYDRSIVETRNYEDGRVKYVENNSLANSLTLSVDQNILTTGGTVSLQSYLYRLDQFDYDMKTYNTQPLRISYTQPLRTYNELKWEKKTAPMEYMLAQKQYLETMQDITIETTQLFFSVLAAQSSYNQAFQTYADRQALYDIAKKRFELGTVTKSDILQMELSLLNEQVNVNDKKLQLHDRLFRFFSFLRLTDYDDAELVPPYSIPDLLVDVDEVFRKAQENTSYAYTQQLNMLSANKELAQARSSKGIQVSLSTELGFTQSASSFSSAYSRLRDNEIIGLSISLPIFDWGVSKGRVKMAEAQVEMAKTKVEQAQMELEQTIARKVMELNSQPMQCRNALRAQDISAERYEISKRMFTAGSISVTELNTAQTEMESAKAQYINQLQTFWVDYYDLQKSTLYDWILQKDIDVDFDKLVK